MSTPACPDYAEFDLLLTDGLEVGRAADLRQHATACTACANRAREIAENLRAMEDLRDGLREVPVSAEAPAQVGGYRILGEIGRGGMGIVYEAEDLSLGRRIALKVLHTDARSISVEAIERLRGEARLLASLNHPNLATVHSLEEADGTHFLTMELLSGESLADRIEQRRLGIEECFLLVRQIAKAVGAAHSRGIVHCDLKPHNVMVSEDGLVKVFDFGLATALERGPASGEPRPSEASGTPGFMSPEQIEGRPPGRPADIWALGCLLYECLVGERPFPGVAPRERLQATLAGDVAWDRLPPEIPGRIVDLIRRCLRRDPVERPAAASEIVSALETELARPVFLDRFETLPPTTGGNLPHGLSTFVGRDREIAALIGHVAESRLVSLIGPGGCGKSRLALEAARRWDREAPDGVWWVDLAPVTDPEAVPRRLADTLRVPIFGTRPALDALVAWLGHRKALLVLDNCEHLISTCAEVGRRVLSETTGTRLLVTSREALGLDAETIVPTPPLPVPPDGAGRADTEPADSVRLFAARVRSIQPDFRIHDENFMAVAQICRRLDGLPLALELAAARARFLSPAEIAVHLDDRFRLLAGGLRARLPRHQTLRASIDWSVSLLSTAERRVFERLGAFSGGWTLEAAESVCAGGEVPKWSVLEHFAALVNKSLVERVREPEPGHPTRYRMLESIRHYAVEKLTASGEGDAVRHRHLETFLALAEEAEPHLRAAEQKAWTIRLSQDQENLTSAIAFAAAAGAWESAMRLAGALGRYWAYTGGWSEGRAIYESLFEAVGDGVRPLPRIKCLNWAGNLTQFQGDLPLATRYLSESLALSRDAGERWYEASAHNNLGTIARVTGDFAAAEDHHRQSLAIREELGDEWAVCLSVCQLGLLAARQGDPHRALPWLERGVSLARSLGDPNLLIVLHVGLGLAHERRTGHSAARCHYEEAFRQSERSGDPWSLALSRHHLAEIALRDGDLEGARAHLHESLRLREYLEDLPSISESFLLLAEYLLSCRRQAEAVQFLEAAAALREANHIGLSAVEREAAERIEAELGRHGRKTGHLVAEARAWSFAEAARRAVEAAAIPTASSPTPERTAPRES